MWTRGLGAIKDGRKDAFVCRASSVVHDNVKLSVDTLK